jgi:predicted PolB exonuclease-like 3'-5' exonuclease
VERRRLSTCRCCTIAPCCTGVSAPRYWDTGDQDQSSRWNNYLSRFHWRHLDLMDVLSGWQPRMVAPLDDIATVLGFPGKLGMDGSKVWAAFPGGRHGRRPSLLRDRRAEYTYLIYLRFELIRGRLSADGYQGEGAAPARAADRRQRD